MIYSKTNPFISKIKARHLLNQPGSTKETYHIELDLRGSNIDFHTGDSVAIIPENDPKTVKNILDLLEISGGETIFDTRNQKETTIEKFLIHNSNLHRISSSLIELAQKYRSHEIFTKLLLPDRKNELRDFISSHTLLSFLEKYKGPLPLQEFSQTISPLLPRFYSISSSLKMHPNEVHLTVALFTTNDKGEKRHGVASFFLCHLAKESVTPVQIYVHKSNGFTLPQDDNTPIIMIGPGTGIAPFRSFMQERWHRGARGKNWLFFGERNREFDFFYKDFWLDLEKKQFLQVHTAFSRDQKDKVYVQHEMYKEKKALWSWIQEGARIYVCGDANQMAKDVDGILCKIIHEEGKMSEEESKQFLKQLRMEKRYLLDVY